MAPDLARDLGELAREVVGYELSRRETALVQLFEPFALLRLETGDVTFELVNLADFLRF